MLKIIRKIAVFLTILLLSVIGIELLCFFAITASNYIIYGLAREGSRVVYDPYTLFLLRDGVRKSEFSSESRDNSKNRLVWMFGGSTMRGSSDFDEQTIPSRVARHLNASNTGFHFTVINYGVDSFNSLLETKYLQKLLIESPSTPDIVIFYDGANESTYFAQYRTPYGHHGYRRLKGMIESYHASWFGIFKPINAFIYTSFTKELYDKIRLVLHPIHEDAPSLSQLINFTERRYDYLSRMASCHDAKFLLIWQPMLWVENCDQSEKSLDTEKLNIVGESRLGVMKNNFRVVYEALASAMNSRSYFVSFRDSLCGRPSSVYFPDGVHLKPIGDEIIGNKIGALIIERFFSNKLDEAKNDKSQQIFAVVQPDNRPAFRSRNSLSAFLANMSACSFSM